MASSCSCQPFSDFLEYKSEANDMTKDNNWRKMRRIYAPRKNSPLAILRAQLAKRNRRVR